MISSSASAQESDRAGRCGAGSEAGVSAAATSPAGKRLWGRRSECAALDRVLSQLRAGGSPVLVLRGDAGVGKTALLDYLLERTSGCRVARAAGVESDMELAFAGLHQLCASMLDRLERLPAPQRDALARAFGLRTGDTPDRFLVGLAILSLLSDVAEERPLVCIVDDAQWLDQESAQVLAFVARRLVAEPIALVCALRNAPDEHELTGIADLPISGLAEGDARALLESVIPGPLDVHVRDRIVAETRGNPLAVLDELRGLTHAELAGGFGLPGAQALPTRIDERLRRQLPSFPSQTQLLLVVAAADPTGDPLLVWRAASELGIDLCAARHAVAAGLIGFGSRVHFSDPGVRSAVYRTASPETRQRVHEALAESTDADVDPDRRAWHRAYAAPAIDEGAAMELERSAGRARARCGLAAEAAFLERAVGLTPDPARRAQRALSAAQAKLEAGAFEAAQLLLAAAETGPLDDLQRVCVNRLRGQVAFAAGSGNNAVPLILAAARQLEPFDAALARDTYLDAFSAATFTGRSAGRSSLPELGDAARRAPAALHQPRTADMLLDGLALRFTDGYAAAAPICTQALQAFCDENSRAEDDTRWLWLASMVAADLWDDETWNVLSTRYVKRARRTGALSEIPLALGSRTFMYLFAGELDAASVLIEDIAAVNEMTKSCLSPYGASALAALQGSPRGEATLVDAAPSEIEHRREGIGVTVTHWASALLCNGHGDFHNALVAARRACEFPYELAVVNWGLGELIEAAARSGRTEVAADAIDQLTERTRASGSDWALGVEARSLALLREGDKAECLYLEAIERLGRTRVCVELARAHLLYGEWLRRANRRIDARSHLRTAHEMLAATGMEAFVERARAELQATGETVRKRTVETRDDLTAQERLVARLAREGLSNTAIGERLFVSPRTVEWHLRNVFTKLGIRSRRELPYTMTELASA